MSRAAHLASRIERTMTGPMWHGPALNDVLAGVTHVQAPARPIAGAHSIWEIVLHLAAWAEIARARVKGQRTADLSADDDWPPVSGTDQDAWTRALEQLGESHRALAAYARALDEAALDANVRSLDYSVEILLSGIVEHGTYHGGQVALLRKALNARCEQA
jgi:uncharacterized damage-inducible protein DinB